jgi:hypothetical protein
MKILKVGDRVVLNQFFYERFDNSNILSKNELCPFFIVIRIDPHMAQSCGRHNSYIIVELNRYYSSSSKTLNNNYISSYYLDLLTDNRKLKLKKIFENII